MPDLSTPIRYMYRRIHEYQAHWVPEGWTANELEQSQIHFMHTTLIADNVGLEITTIAMNNITNTYQKLQAQPDTPATMLQRFALLKMFFEARVREIKEYISTTNSV